MKIMRTFSFVLSALLFSFSTVAADKNPDLTHGNVQMTLTVNKTTQLEVVETFGAPNITTLDAQRNEVWVYRRHARVSSVKNSSGGFSIGLLGIGNDVGGAIGFGKKTSKSNAEQTYRSMTLVIKFGPDGVVSDFRSRSSSF